MITREEALERLKKLHKLYEGHWYGLDNASDEEIVDVILYDQIRKHTDCYVCETASPSKKKINVQDNSVAHDVRHSISPDDRIAEMRSRYFKND